MNITLNGTVHAVEDGASVTTLISQVTGGLRCISPVARLA